MSTSQTTDVQASTHANEYDSVTNNIVVAALYSLPALPILSNIVSPF